MQMKINSYEHDEIYYTTRTEFMYVCHDYQVIMVMQTTFKLMDQPYILRKVRPGPEGGLWVFTF